MLTGNEIVDLVFRFVFFRDSGCESVTRISFAPAAILKISGYRTNSGEYDDTSSDDEPVGHLNSMLHIRGAGYHEQDTDSFVSVIPLTE